MRLHKQGNIAEQEHENLGRGGVSVLAMHTRPTFHNYHSDMINDITGSRT